MKIKLTEAWGDLIPALCDRDWSLWVQKLGQLLGVFSKTTCPRASLVVQCLRLRLPMQGVKGAKIPHALWPKNQNVKQKQYYNKFNKNFKNGPH